MTLQELLSKYRRERQVRPKTAKHRLEIVRTFEKDTGVTDTDELTYEVLLQWRQDVLNRATVATWDNYYKGLRTLWNFGLEADYFDNNPFARIKREKIAVSPPKTLDETLIAEAIEHLMSDENTLNPGWFWALVIRTFYYTGMRRNQLVCLRWGDLSGDFTECALTSTHVQGREDHTIVLDPEIRNSLRDLRRITDNVLGREPSGDEQVFNVTLFNRRYRGGAMTTDHVAGFFGRLSGAVGVKITPHRLRDTMAVRLIEKTHRLTSVGRILGHQDGRTTLRYVPADLRDQRAVVGDLPRL